MLRRVKGVRKGEMVVTAIILGGGMFVVGMLFSAFIQGEIQRKEMPIRALIGDEAFFSWKKGEGHPFHYYGNNRRVPSFELKDDEGKTFRMSENRGKIVVMNFWMSSCAPCIQEMPSLIALAQRLKTRKDVGVVAISADPSWEEVRKVVPRNSALRVLLDPERKVITGRFGTRLFPETWVIDRDGIIRLRVDGPRNWDNPIAIHAIMSF
ncbi:MAG: TlpA family protein disulfide reductase [Sandaracinaceae bacterium]|nr:TlpA family protein disulfide reductase [Sandaracinaceae bacterium]MDW8246635.1 TlpA disulfide reductase family protein [Sandaracinaceae bacterium]